MDDQPQAPPLPHYYTAEDHGAVWHLYCRKCHAGWSLPKEAADKPGNLMRLINHAAAHEGRERKSR